MYNSPVVLRFAKIFDKIESRWNSRSFMKSLGTVLVLFYLLSLLFIALQRAGWLSPFFYFVPTNFFRSIELAFTLLLFFEVIELVLSLVKSVAKSMYIQLEILSLILLRSAFKVVGDFPDVINMDVIKQDAIYMFADAFGALLIFLGVFLIKRFGRHLSICRTEDGLRSFITIKKLLSLSLLFLFTVLILFDIFYFFSGSRVFNFFHIFYTILIFSDVLIVFLSLRYSDSYLVLFRNSGFALGTVVIRLALNSAAPLNALLGIVATFFLLCLVYFYNKAYADEVKGKKFPIKFSERK